MTTDQITHHTNQSYRDRANLADVSIFLQVAAEGLAIFTTPLRPAQ